MFSCPLCPSPPPPNFKANLKPERLQNTRVPCFECRAAEGSMISQQNYKIMCSTCAEREGNHYKCKEIDISIIQELNGLLLGVFMEPIGIPKTNKGLNPVACIMHLLTGQQPEWLGKAAEDTQELLRNYPNLPLESLAYLLHFIKADCTDCDTIKRSGYAPIGRRVPTFKLQDFHSVRRASELLPHFNLDLVQKKPWHVKEFQVELIGVIPSRSVELYGIELAAALEGIEGKFECFDVFEVELAAPKLIYEKDLANQYTFTGIGNPVTLKLANKGGFTEVVHVVKFSKPTVLLEGKAYILKYQLSPGDYHRCSKHSLKQTAIGSDSTEFKFVNVTNLTLEVLGEAHEDS
eukprot:CAMPEP_0204907238 /NCGR_PEP_ID=MMETSP1397-20131031/6431_1 /ASSEMBLY_ACC=CAM_ASM_000891 /TAXON_ID=49980 /ORGANISM="Climacostomum Climacostomum virens, Strain Stock W-24" /LENGTH=348 /DNA_ID=CAMNT_0052076311 /DNA_START=382 /DNA_END=1425 /DNA_ORIENTATION=+